MSLFPIAIMLNSQILVVNLKISKVVRNSNSTQIRQQYIRCNYTKFQLKILNFVGYVLNFLRVSNICQFYYRNDRERNGTLTGMGGSLWKKY